MENLDTGKDKIKKICEILKNETLQPAQQEAQKIIEAAQQQARTILRDAESKSEEMVRDAKGKIAKEQELFESSIKQACRQGIASLRQDIENTLFNAELDAWLKPQTLDPQLAAKLINAVVAAIEKEGTSANFSALIPPQIPAQAVNAHLLKGVIEKLREKGVVVGDGELSGGVRVQLHDRKLTLDLSDQALKELIGHYVRRDFREILFHA